MPRRPRRISAIGIYHIVMRSVNRQDIFEEIKDFEKFLSVIRECMEIDDYEIYAYCLMTDHIHMLLHTTNGDLSLIMQRIASRFAVWYNKKYQRTGHLFQERFGSKAVKDERYLITAWRYILQNPLRAGLEKEIGHYRWTSYGAYIGLPDGITETQSIASCFSTYEFMMEYLKCEGKNDRAKMEIADGEKLSDESALYLLFQVSGCKNTSEFQTLQRGQRNQYIYELHKLKIPSRQITRITGVSRITIERTIRRREQVWEQMEKEQKRFQAEEDKKVQE